MSVSHDHDQSIGEFTLSLDRQLRRRFNMGVERYKALKNCVLAILIGYVGLQTGMEGYYIILCIIAVGAPDALELFLGNGLKVSLEDGGNDDE